MKNTSIILGFGLILLLLSACKGGGDPQVQTPKMPGSDRDEHGCIGSAGYTWSRVAERCIRPFEDGVKLLPTEKPEGTSAVLAAYAVFGADSLRAELFLPSGGKNIVLDRRELPSGGFAWNTEDDDTYNLRKDPASGAWVVERRGKALYQAR